jgi:hypothetical protein
MCVATCKGNMSIAVGMCVDTCMGNMFIAVGMCIYLQG